MLLPTSQLYVLILLVISMLGWACWPSLFKSASRWRFELFEYDLALGVLVTALLAAFTLGLWDSKELTFQDNFLLTGYRNIGWAFVAGFSLCFSTLCLMGAVTISGMATAFPMAFGIALGMLSIWNFITNTQISAMLSFGGAAAVVLGGILAVVAHFWYMHAIATETAAVLHSDPRLKPTKNPTPASGLGVVLAVLAGLGLGFSFRALDFAGANENGLSPYGTVLIMAVGFMGSSVVIVPFFLYFPVKGAGLQVRHYFRGTLRHHVLGALGGVLLAAAILSSLLAKKAPLAIQVEPMQFYVLDHGAPILAILLGMFVWKEFAGGATRVMAMIAAAAVLLIAGMAVIAIAPVYGK